MTAICGGGPSAAKPLVDPAIAFTASAIDAILTARGFGELGPIIAVIASGLALTTDVYCTSDPPADPGLTQSDITAALNPLNPVAYTTAVGRIKDWFLHWYWWEVCQCSTVATPPPPVITLPPGTGTNTGLPPGGPSEPCWTVTLNGTMPGYRGHYSDTLVDLTPQLLPPNPPTYQVNIGVDTPVNTQAQTIPAGTNGGHMTATFSPNLEGGVEGIFSVQFYNSAGAEDNSWGFITDQGAGGGSFTATAPIPSTAVYWAAYIYNTGQTPPAPYQVTFSFFCSNPNTLQVPCCPPDPLVQQFLNQILQLVTQLYANQTTESTTWVDGVHHTGISGTGSFQLARKVTGLRITFTTIPTDIRQTPGTPTFYWSLGFVTPLAEDVPLRSLRTVFQSQASALPVQTTGISYTFPPGVIADLVELLPGPVA